LTPRSFIRGSYSTRRLFSSLSVDFVAFDVPVADAGRRESQQEHYRRRTRHLFVEHARSRRPSSFARRRRRRRRRRCRISRRLLAFRLPLLLRRGHSILLVAPLLPPFFARCVKAKSSFRFEGGREREESPFLSRGLGSTSSTRRGASVAAPPARRPPPARPPASCPKKRRALLAGSSNFANPQKLFSARGETSESNYL